MLVLDRQSPGSTNSPKRCHPERSLAMSKANRQTKSKDPVPAGGTTGDMRNSHPGAWRTLALAGLALVAIPSLAQTSKRFPGPKSELTSPNGRYVLRNEDHYENYKHFIFLKDKTAGKSREVYEYGRSATVVWSPDSQHFAINDYAGSDYTETTILSVDEGVPKIDVQEEVARKGDVTLGGDHEYFGVAYWVDDRRVVIHHWGYGNGDPVYCECYIYTLNGPVRKCTRQPNPTDDDFCERTTP